MRRVAIAAGVGFLLGLSWWGVFELIASGAVCTKDEFGCLGTAIVTVPVFAVVGGMLGWLALRALAVGRAWLVALIGTVCAVAAQFLLLGQPYFAAVSFAALYGLAALVTVHA